MAITDGFVASLTAIHPREIIEALQSDKRPKGTLIWAIKNEIRPVDLYCYLGARFGPPNGFQNFLRRDDSNNLIHWDWTLSCEYGWISFLGMNYRTEVQLIGVFPFHDSDKDTLIACLKADFANHGAKMSHIRNNLLEKWTEFSNPYYRIRNAVDRLLEELSGLSLDPKNQAIPDFLDHSDPDSFKEKWNDLGVRYSKGLGICFGIRSMLPVMAEAFANLVLFTLMKPDLKNDQRMRDNAFRQPIDIRIKSLHLNCIGFGSPVDYSNKACADYHSIVNDRNDLLHGNVSIDKLKFNEVFFHGRVPVFQEYQSMWDRSVGVDVKTVGLEKVLDEVAAIQAFITYVLSCLEPKMRSDIQRILDKRDLGRNEEDGRLGILFPDHLMDMRILPGSRPMGEKSN